MSKVINFVTNSISIKADLFEPSTATYPVVVVSYGTEGMNSPFDNVINEFCLELLKEHIAVIRPDYFKSTNTSPGMHGVFMAGPTNRFNTWIEAISDAAKFALSLPNANGKFAFIGFSLGANLSLRAAANFAQKPVAVVDFFGPIESIPQSQFSPTLAAKLPPVQIHHGDMDGIVKFSESDKLESWLKAAGVACEFNRMAYPSTGHPGQKRARELAPMLPNADWSLIDQKNSLSSTITFLRKYI